MKIFLGFLLLLGETALGQHRVLLHITNEDTRQPIAGASVMVKGSDKGGMSDSAGVVLLVGMKGGNYVLQVSCTGYTAREIKLVVPVQGEGAVPVTLEPDVEMLGGVVVKLFAD